MQGLLGASLLVRRYRCGMSRRRPGRRRGGQGGEGGHRLGDCGEGLGVGEVGEEQAEVGGDGGGEEGVPLRGRRAEMSE